MMGEYPEPQNILDDSKSKDGQFKVKRLYLHNLKFLLKLYRYEYVKAFEQADLLLPNTWIVVRIDGRGFHK
jgi:hypothetical protein